MNINLVAVGKIKEKFFQDACKEYLKRLSKYHSIRVIEVKDEKAPEKLSLKEEEKIKEIEGEEILKFSNQSQYLIALDIEGISLDSIGLSDKMEAVALSGKSEITFFIGGSLGLSKTVLKAADFRLSFSKMTFPHQLMRVILLEQLFRASKIRKNEPYHK